MCLRLCVYVRVFVVDSHISDWKNCVLFYFDGFITNEKYKRASGLESRWYEVYLTIVQNFP